MLIKDTENSIKQNGWFAVEDINRRAAHAYNTNRAFFDSIDHQAKVAMVERIGREYFASWAVIYNTARNKTRNRPAHTEIKFSRVILNRKRKRSDFLAALAAIGVAATDVVCKPATESYSIHVK